MRVTECVSYTWIIRALPSGVFSTTRIQIGGPPAPGRLFLPTDAASIIVRLKLLEFGALTTEPQGLTATG
ncbi:MAG: hypothetical protein ACI9W6_000886 [Motiliproteus sp.]|jgi:hypothetical protein